MKITKAYLNNLLAMIKSAGILKTITKRGFDPDEPPMHSFSAYLESSKDFSDGYEYFADSGGFSFFNKEVALFKCLVEAVERFSLVCFRKNDILSGRYSDFTNNLDPCIYTNNKKDRDHLFGWVIGENLTGHAQILIPAQLVYLNYSDKKNEPDLTESISTGAAGGTDKESTILRGLYEIIERDAFMTLYLNRFSPKRMEVCKLNIKKAVLIAKKAARYNLETLLFDITNDLTIPTFLTILLDKTGLGPAICLGLKSSLSAQEAVAGSMEEAFYTRPWIKKLILKHRSNVFFKDYAQINDIVSRALHWTDPRMLQELDFLLEQKPQPIEVKNRSHQPRNALEKILKILNRKGFYVYCVDITPKFLKKCNIMVYKTIVPQLQPLYLHENRKEFRRKRLQDTASYFKTTYRQPNTIPHPFL